MKNLKLILVLFISFIGYSQTSLLPGDIVITGFNSDNPDQITFVLLKDVVTETKINFTDNGWTSSGDFRRDGSGNTSEGTLEWKSTSDLTCGTEITITLNSASTGTITEIDSSFALSAGGDQILAYQGTEMAPEFIFGVSFDSSGWSDAIDPNSSALPEELTDGTNALNLEDTDNAAYDCTVTEDPALILAAVSTATNWLKSDDIITLGGCTYSCTLPPCSEITWDGNVWSNTVGPDLNTSVRLTGDYRTELATVNSFSACNLIIEPTATLIINEGDFVNIENDITNSGKIIIQDKASLVQRSNTALFTNTSTVIEPVTVDKNTAPVAKGAWYEYTYWSSPIKDVAIGDFLPNTSPNRLFKFNAENFNDLKKEKFNTNEFEDGEDDIDDDANDWEIIAGTSIMEAGHGYSATLSLTDLSVPDGGASGIKQTFRGSVLNSGTITVTAKRNDVSRKDSNWNLIGNPYPSAIDVTAFLNKNMYDAIDNPSGVIDGAIYFWSQQTPPSATASGNEPLNFDVNNYAVLNGTAPVSGEKYFPKNFIPSGQGFFISFSENHEEGVGNIGDIIFTNDMRVTGDNDQFFRGNPKMLDNKLWLNLTSDTEVFSQIVIGYVSGATNGFDGSFYDARRIFYGDSAMLFSTIENNDNEYAIQGKSSESLTIDESINIGITTAIDSPTLYTLDIDHFEGDFMTNESIYLKDNLMGIVHNLKQSDYTFTSETGVFKDRFEIVFNEETLSNNDYKVLESKLSIIELKGNNIKFSINDSNLKIKSIKILDLLGREIYNLRGNKNAETYNLSQLNSAPYIAQVTLSNGIVINKRAIKK